MRKGFSLLEFLVFGALLLAVSTVLLPRALGPRRDLNEEQAVGYLAMIGGAERAWREAGGAHVSLQRAAQTGPPGERGEAAPPLLPPDLLFDARGVAHRGGFRFRLARDEDGRIAGCWAWPNLRGYSGRHTYWAGFAAREVRRARDGFSWKDEPPAEAPADQDLDPEPLATF